MIPVTSSQAQRAFNWTLVASVPLLLGVCVLLLGWQQGVSLAFASLVQVAVAFGTMFVLGYWAAPRWGPRCAARPLLAGLFAVGVFLVGVLAGCSTSMLLYWDFDPEAWLLRPLVWLGFVGGVPAFLVGLLSSRLARRLPVVSRPA